MDTKKYEVLEKTVELSSLTKAAQELGLTQSGVSHMLAAIEAELQLPLLKLTRTGARLTPMIAVTDLRGIMMPLPDTVRPMVFSAASTAQISLVCPSGMSP